MADNVAVTAGSGTTIATDDISGVQHQRVKVVIGADGVNDGDVSASNPLPVDLTKMSGSVLGIGQGSMAASIPVVIASNQSAVSVSNTGVFATQIDGNALTALQLIDDPVASTGTPVPAKAMFVAGTDGTNATALKTDAGGELQVDVLSIAAGDNNIGNVDIVTMPNVTIGTMAALVAGTANIGDVDVLTVNGVAPAFGSGARGATVQRVTIATDDVVPSSQSGTWTVQPGNTANTTPWLFSETPATSGGLTVANLNGGDTFTALTSTAQVIKGSAGQIYGWYIYNPNTVVSYVIVYNIAAASVTVGTSTPAMVFAIPPGSAANATMDGGIAFGTAISAAATTTAGGNTAPSTALDVMFFYK